MRAIFQGTAAVAVAGLLLLPGCQPSGPEALAQGDRELQAGRTEEAIQLLELAATKLPTEAQVWNRLGLAYHAAGRTSDAHKAYRRALEFNRNLFDVRFNLGVLLLEQGLAREAEAEYRTYLNASPDNARNPDAWRGVGLALLAQKQYANAETALRNAVQLDARDAEAWNGLGLVRIQLRRHREAYQAFQQAAQTAPDLASARLNLAVTAHQHFNDRRTALQHYRDFLVLQPAGPESDAVRQVVQDIEVKLGLVRAEPPPIPTNTPPATGTAITATNVVGPASTNRPAPALVRSNPPPRPPIVITSAPPAVRTAPSNPPKAIVAVSNPPPPKPAIVATTTPPAVAVTPPIAATNPPQPAAVPEVPLEVVQVTEDPLPRRANDLLVRPMPTGRLDVPIPAARPPETTFRPPTPTPAVEPPAVEPSAPKTTSAATDPIEQPDEPASLDENGKPRRRFWGKVNPVNWGNPTKWFRKGTPDAPEVPDKEAAASPTAKASIKVTPLLPPPAPAKPSWPRYTRLNPLAPARGNRVAAEVEYQKGASAHQAGKLPAAIAAYNQAVQLDPSHFEAQHNLALATLQQGDLKSSLRISETAVALDPSSANARYNLAVALQRSRFPVDAAEELDRITRQHPDDPNAHLALATLCAGDLAEPDRARTHYERVLALQPDHPQAANIRRWLERTPAR